VKDGTGDLGRIRRQQYFIRSLAQDAIHAGMGNVSTAINLIHKSLKSLTVEKGFGASDLSPLINAFHNSDPGAIEMVTIPADIGSNSRGQSVLNLRATDAAPIFARLRNGPAPKSIKPPSIPTSSVKVDVRNGNGISGAATQTRTKLEGFGFLGAGVGDAPEHVANTQVRYASGDRTRAELVAAYVGGVAKLVSDSTQTRGTVQLVLGADFAGVSAPAGSSGTTTGTHGSTTTTLAPNPGHTTGVTVPVTERGRPLVGCG
jgi:hypothetical protein